MLHRLKFWLDAPKFPFTYDQTTGAGTALESYNMFTDKVTVRYSRCGYVTGHETITRKVFLERLAEKNEEGEG